MAASPILAVGSIALDTIETPNGKCQEILGGSATFFGVAAALFAPVRLVGVVGSDYPDEGWQLFQSRGIDVTDVQRAEGATFRWGGRYSADLDSRETLFTELGVFENFRPSLTDASRDCRIVYLGNIQPSLQLVICGEMRHDPTVISDTMNLWIDHNLDELKQVLTKSHILLISDEEALQLTGQSEVSLATDRLLQLGPSTVVVKLGRAGAILATGSERTLIPIYHQASRVDPTGAGDSFAGGLIGHLANHDGADLEAAVIMGTAAASYTIEGFGLEGLLRATPAGIRARAETVRKGMD